MEEIVRLRGHHILCLLGFRGLGYSREFVENMARVQEIILGHSGAIIQIVEGPDDICAACPRLSNGECDADSPTRIRIKDATILSLLGLQPGDRLAPDLIYRKVAEAIAPEDLADICSQCQWLALGFCEQGLSRLSQGRLPAPFRKELYPTELP